MTNNNSISNSQNLPERALELSLEDLAEFTNGPDFTTKMQIAFGEDFLVGADDFQKDWRMPQIEIRDSAEIGGANGAYAGATNTVYISREFLESSPADAASSVLLEELGHAIDWQWGDTDAPGDEGAIFSALVRGELLSEEYLQELRLEDDSATVWLDGELVAIEQRTIEGTEDDDSLTVFRLLPIFLGEEGFIDAWVNGITTDSAGSLSEPLIVDGKGGNDRLGHANPNTSGSLGVGGSITIDLTNGIVQLSDKSYTIKNIENASGSVDDDIIIGDDRDNILGGGDGNDIIEGSYGDDTINGGNGNDTIDGGSGNDTLVVGYEWSIDEDIKDVLRGGENNDTYTLINNDGGIVEDTSGSDDALTLYGFFGSSKELSPTLAKDSTGVKQDDTDLIIDLNQDGVANRDEDLTIIDFYEKIVDETTGLVTYKKGSGYIENMNVPVDLSVTKTDSSDPAVVNEELTYTLTVKNESESEPIALFLNSDATKVVLTDVLPEDVDFVNAAVSQGTFTETDGTVTFELGNIEAGKEATAEIVVKPTEPTVPEGEEPPTSWEITNTATVEAFQTDTNESNNKAEETTKVHKKDCPDTTPIKLEAEGGGFFDTDNDGKCEAEGTIYIGRTDGIERMLRVENATAEHDDKELTISGIVYSEIGNVKAPLFQGSFTMPFNKGTTTSFQETNKLTEEYKIAGTDIDFYQLTLEPKKILFGSKFKLPKDVGGSLVDATGKDALLIDREGATLARGRKISLDKIPKVPLFGMLDAELSNLSLEYIAPQDTLKLEGKATFDSFAKTPKLKKITADFSGQNYIEIKDDKVDLKGSIVVEGDLKVGKKGWGLSEVKLDFDTKKKDIGGSTKLKLPFGKKLPTAELEMGFKLPISPLELNKVAGSVDGLNLWVPKTPIFFQKFGLGLENFAPSDPDPIEGSVSTAATFGPQIPIKDLFKKGPAKSFFDFVGIDGDVSLARLDLEGKISSEQVEGKSLVTIFHEKIGKVQGKATLNWDKQFLKTSGNLSLLDGFIKSRRELEIYSDLSINTGGEARVNVPDFIPFINNQTLASGNFSFKFSNDNDFSNDFVAGWGTLLDQTLGSKVYFDGEVDWLGAENVATVGENFRIKKGQDLLLMNADWEGENSQRRSSQNNVPIEVKTPGGKWIKESQFAANNIEIVDNLEDSTQKTVLISNPQAGKWNIRVAQEGLGKVEYSALQNTSGAPTLELKSAVVNDKKSKVTIDYEASDANSEAEISFFYDTDNKDFNGTLIKDGLVEKDKKGRFVWNTKDVPDGKYYIYGTIEDENNVPVMSYSPVKITVGNPLPDGKTKVGNGKKNKLKGTGKDDLLDGKGGNDILIGNNGDDTLIGGGGKDILNGGNGNDTYKLNAKNAKGSLIIDSKGNDTLELDSANISLNGLAKRKTGFAAIGKNLVIDINRDGKANSRDLSVKNFFANNKAKKPGKGFIETVDNVSGDAIIDALNDSTGKGIVKNGNNKNNTLKGSNKDDLLNGKGGNDKLYGQNGDDTLIGGGGKDILNGGGGDDTYKLNAKNARGSLIIDSKGKDALELSNANISLNGLAKRKTGFAAIGKNLVIDINKDGKANNRDLTIRNFFANNKANKAGKGFIETVDNVSGNKVIQALGKNKVQRRSNEIAEDTLTGGGGEYGSEVEDAITDFIIGEADRIDLPGDQFLKLDPEIDFAEQFAAVGSDKAAATSDAYIAYNSNNGNLFYNANGDKAGFGAGGGLFAKLDSAPDLGATDFAIQP